jgi:hypothetical protein
MHLTNINFLIRSCTNFTCARQFFAQLLMVLCLVSSGYPSMLLAGKTYPQCFPLESAWENIEIETVNLPEHQNPMVKLEGRAVTLTFNKFESYLPQFYGFAFLKEDIPDDIPKITERSVIEAQFHDVKLVALDRKKIVGDDENKSYRFTPPTKGTWVIYLVASINKIAFLEQRDLRISPQVENIRGGSIFSGSSLNLVEPIDYKACVIPLEL